MQNKIKLNVSGFEECFIKICGFKSEKISKFCKKGKRTRGKVKKYKKERNLKALRSSRPHTWLKKKLLYICSIASAHDVPRLFITSSLSNSFVKNISVKLFLTLFSSGENNA